jgi:predicted CoA-binding protein
MKEEDESVATMDAIEDFLGQRRLALIGVSRKPADFSRTLFREFRERGYEAVPVNPGTSDIDGERCFPRVQDVQPPVSGALLMTDPKMTEAVVRDCVAAGVKRIWLFRGGGKGSVTPAAVQLCEANGISVVPGECPMMFLQGAGWFHRFHGFVKKIAGTYPS